MFAIETAPHLKFVDDIFDVLFQPPTPPYSSNPHISLSPPLHIYPPNLLGKQ